MTRWFISLLALLLGLSWLGCAPPRQPPPDLERIRQDHGDSQQDLREEEDRQKDRDEDEE